MIEEKIQNTDEEIKALLANYYSYDNSTIETAAEKNIRKRLAQNVMYKIDTMCEQKASDHELFIKYVGVIVDLFANEQSIKFINEGLDKIKNLLPDTIEYKDKNINVTELINEAKDFFINY